MYLVVIAWIYVVLMMAVAEATSTNGTVLGAIVTFLLYGLMPIALVVYLMGSPFRRRAIKQKEAAEFAAFKAAQKAAQEAVAQDDAQTTSSLPDSLQPDAGSKPPADAVTPMRKEP